MDQNYYALIVFRKLILCLPNDFNKQLCSENCEERKESMKLMEKILMENPKLANNPNYSGLIETFIKVLYSIL
jgi:hypothetical protein